MCNPLPTETVIHKGTRIARATRLQDESLVAPVTDTLSKETNMPEVSESKSKLLWEMIQNCAADLSEEEKEMLYHVWYMQMSLQSPTMNLILAVTLQFVNSIEECHPLEENRPAS